MQFLRLGFDGYRKIMVNLMQVAAHLAKGILDTGVLAQFIFCWHHLNMCHSDMCHDGSLFETAASSVPSMLLCKVDTSNGGKGECSLCSGCSYTPGLLHHVEHTAHQPITAAQVR